MSLFAYKTHTSRPVKCSICEESVKSPKQLPCDHKFCSDCINRQISRLSMLLDAQEKVSIVCPYCRDFFLSSISCLQTDQRRSRPKSSRPNLSSAMKNKVAGDRKAERCQPCADGAHYELATFWCQNCSEYMCSTCTKYHTAMKMSKSHVVKTIRDKERYEHIETKVYEARRPYSARTTKDLKPPCSKDAIRLYCEPCNSRNKTKVAKHICEVCSEQMCEDCTKCHRAMKMSKSHKLIPVKDVLCEEKSQYSLDLKCDKHYKEPLSLFCKRCQISCCAICALTDHVYCKTNSKSDYKSKKLEKPKVDQNYKRVPYEGDTKVVTDSDKGKSLSVDTKQETNDKIKKEVQVKSKIAEKRMETRKGRLEVESPFENDWIISMVVLSNGDILLLQLYDTKLKMMDSLGNIIAECTLNGNPWSVGVYNDSLAVVTFTDRKQLQLINISKSGLEAGKLIKTRHRCLAVCFASNLIAATCWEGCVHLINIAGQEVAIIDTNADGQRLFTNPEFIAANKLGTTLYVTDYKRHTVTALKLLPNKIDNKPVFVFTHTDLRGPKGVDVDKEGVVYVSGMDSRNIFRISPAGELIQLYRRREDTEYYEALAMSSAGDKLFVSAYEDSTICVLRFRK